MKNVSKAIWMLGLLATFSAGCATTDAGSEGGTIGGTIPTDSDFAKVAMGMTKQELLETIGEPGDKRSRPTAKSLLPFYYGGDSIRSEWFYKGQGRITLVGGNAAGSKTLKVRLIVYDPTEDGKR